MSKLDELRARRDAALAAAEAIANEAAAEGRQPTRDEGGRFKALMDEYRRLDANVAGQEGEQVEATRQAKLNKVTRQIEPEQIAWNPGNSPRIEVPRVSPASLRSFKGANAGDNAYLSGMFLVAALGNPRHAGTQRAAQWCAEHRVQVTGTVAGGGALVPSPLENTIIDLRNSYGVARQECRIVPMSSDTLTIPRRADGLTAEFVGEESAITASDKTWNNVQLTAKKVATLTRVSSELMEDAVISIADDLADEAAWAFAKKEDECLVDGDGTSTYGGMVGFRTKMIDGNHAGSTMDATGGDDNFVELISADLAALTAQLPDYAEGRAKWYMSRYAWGACCVRLLAAMAGATMHDVVSGVRRPEYLGYPVVIVNAMPGYTATNWNGGVMIAFGDMRQAATLGDRRGITVKVDESRFLEYDQAAVRVTERFDIVVHDIGDTTDAGPLVAILGST